MKRLLLTPAASDDLSDIWDYGAEIWGADRADKYTESIWNACNNLATGSRLGRPCEVSPEFKKYLCGSHVIFFLLDEAALTVVRILHQKQDPYLHL